jgi:DNA gyrase subunit A
VEARAHIVEGLLVALTRVDDVIEIVRSAPDQNSARDVLMEESGKDALGLTREQADAVLRLQLGQLTRLNKDKLEEEKADLEASQKRLRKLMTVDQAVRDAMKKEFEELKTKFGKERRTRIEMEDGGDLNEMDLIRNSRSVIVVTRGGYIKRMPLKTFETQGRRTRGKKGTSDSSSDSEVANCFTCNDHDTLLMITQKGIAYGLRAYQVPTGSRTAKGQPIPSVLPVMNDDMITAILPVSDFSRKDEYLILATKQGWIKKTALTAFENMSSRGLTIAFLEPGDQLLWSQRCTDDDDVLIGSTLGMATRFAIATLRATERRSRGVISMKLREGDSIADMNVLRGSSNNDRQQYALAVTSNGYGKRVKTEEFRTQARGGRGVIAIKFKKGNDEDEVRCLSTVTDDDEVLLITAKGIMVRQKVSDIASQSRSATGVLVQKVDVENGDHISSVSIVPKYEEQDE